MIDADPIEAAREGVAKRINAASTTQRQLNWRDLAAVVEGAQQLAELNLHVAALTAAVVTLAERVTPASPPAPPPPKEG